MWPLGAKWFLKKKKKYVVWHYTYKQNWHPNRNLNRNPIMSPMPKSNYESNTEVQYRSPIMNPIQKSNAKIQL
jgi:hypothetical protein